MFKTAVNNATEGLVRHPLNWFAKFKYCSYISQELAKMYIVLMWPETQYSRLGCELFAEREKTISAILIQYLLKWIQIFVTPNYAAITLFTEDKNEAYDVINFFYKGHHPLEIHSQ